MQTSSAIVALGSESGANSPYGSRERPYRHFQKSWWFESHTSYPASLIRGGNDNNSGLLSAE